MLILWLRLRSGYLGSGGKFYERLIDILKRCWKYIKIVMVY